MASYPYSSTSSSDISTPRSISPSSSAGRSSQSSISNINKRMSISSSRRISAANPMSSVDIATIEEAMRTANLDTMRGYTPNTPGEVRQHATTEYLTHNQALGYQILTEPLWNKGEPVSFFLLPPPSSHCHSCHDICNPSTLCDRAGKTPPSTSPACLCPLLLFLPVPSPAPSFTTSTAATVPLRATITNNR